jgi:hypothetical protein
MFIPKNLDWTIEERLYVIGMLARELHSEAGKQGEQRTVDYAERINFVATMPKAFLEQNKNQILGDEDDVS